GLAVRLAMHGVRPRECGDPGKITGSASVQRPAGARNRRNVPFRRRGARAAGTDVPLRAWRRIHSCAEAMAQEVRCTTSRDGRRRAWAAVGSGPPLVKASNWLTHLEYDLESPVWRHWIRFYAGNFRCVRYDERGCGMSEWKLTDHTFERW